MKSRATRNIQIEKQTRRVLSQAAASDATRQSEVKPKAKKSAKKKACSSG